MFLVILAEGQNPYTDAPLTSLGSALRAE